MAATTTIGRDISEGIPTSALTSTIRSTVRIVNSPTTASSHGLRALTARFYTRLD